MTSPASPWTPRWTPREPPLPAVAAAASGPAARALAAAVIAGRDDGSTARLRAAHAADWLVVLSDDPAGADLPWADGVHWLGRDSGLLVPTHLTLQPDPGLVARAAARHVPDAPTLVVLLPGLLLSTPTPRRPVATEQLRQLLQGERA
ncbi:bpX5 domain-containing protein [Streptomyces sp.]